MNFFNRVAACSLALVLTFALSGCGNGNSNDMNSIVSPSIAGDSSTAAGTGETEPMVEVTLGVCFSQYDDAYLSAVRLCLEEIAKESDKVTLLLNDSKNDQNAQNDQIDDLILKKADALLINIVDTDAAQDVIDKAKTADIPVIFFDQEPDEEVLKDYEKVRFVGARPEEAGIIQGEMALELWGLDEKLDKNGDSKISYVMLIGDTDSPEAIARTKYSVDVITSSEVEAVKLGEQVCDWDRDKANAAMETWLAEEGDNIELVLANNDSMAVGAVTALQSAGYNNGGDKYIPVFGVDATDEAKDLIDKGYMSGTVRKVPVAMAKAVISLGLNVATTRDFVQNTDYKYDESGIAVRIPYQAYTGE